LTQPHFPLRDQQGDIHAVTLQPLETPPGASVQSAQHI